MSQNFPGYGVCTGKPRTAMSFIFGYFHQKVMTKLHEKYKKAPFWTLFAHFTANKNFSWKSASVIFFCFTFLLLCRISLKCKEQILRKVGYRHTDQDTDAKTSMNS